jgi:hypothetical protein
VVLGELTVTVPVSTAQLPYHAPVNVTPLVVNEVESSE